MLIRPTPIKRHLAIFCFLLLGGGCIPGMLSAQSAVRPASAPLPPFTFQDIREHHYELGTPTQQKATVFLFVSTQCPIANAYTPRLIALGRDYSSLGVRFFLVDSNAGDSLERVRRYAKERDFPFPAVKDRGTTLADYLGASRTPEAVILDASNRVCYRGGIDDSRDSAQVVHHFVREALDSVLAGKPVSRPRMLPIGCAIFRDTVRPSVTMAANVTYTRDVAPILNKNCMVCHRDGEAAPFALTNYLQARTWASAIKDYTVRRLMPPWKAAPGYGDFHDARTLSDKEIATLAAWADSGAPEGAQKDLPPAPHFPPAAQWAMGKPDLVLMADRPYHLEADGKDVYREFVMPVTFKEDRYIDGMEFKAGNRTIVHHIIVFFDPSGKTAELDGKEKEPGYTVPGTEIGVPGAIWVAGWAPGNTARFLPAGTAFKLPANARIVLQVHYHKDGKPEADQSRVALHFVDKAKVDKEMTTGALINFSFDLKPNVAHQKVQADITLPFDVHVWAVMPHMHMLGREMKVMATLPDGKQIPMIYIKDWDFNWQETYRYKQPLALPKGTKVQLTAYFDNTEQNPHQPTHPPKEVFWGEQTTDEMCISFFQFTLDKQHLAAQTTASRK